MAAKKKTSSAPTLERHKSPNKFRLPEKLATKPVTIKSLKKGSFQSALLAHAAPELIIEMLNCVRRSLCLDDMQAAKLTAELYGMSGKGGAGVNINVNQTNANVSESRGGRSNDGPASFEQIQQILEEEERTRKAIPASFEAIYEPTPDAIIEQ